MQFSLAYVNVLDNLLGIDLSELSNDLLYKLLIQVIIYNNYIIICNKDTYNNYSYYI